MWKWIAIILGLLCAAFIALGFFKPEVSAVNSTLINRSPEVVWRIFTDPARAKEWMTGLDSIQTISGGHLQPGSVHKLVFIDGDRRMDLSETVTAVEPNRLFAFDSSMEEMHGTTNVILAPRDAGTELTFESVYRGNSIVWRSMMVIMEHAINERETVDLARLKLLVEKE
ncbi:MAG: SRPBCC family protein, partial [Steroidobacterales bacterium]